MILYLAMPRVVEEMDSGEIYHWVPAEGDYVNFGDTFLDIYVELDPDFQGNCPPVFHLEITANDAGYLRRVLAPQGSRAAAEAPLAVFSTEPDEPLPALEDLTRTATPFRFMTQTI